jgi:hypothetical protein
VHLNGFLEQYVDVLEVGDHKLFVLGGLAFQSEFVYSAKRGVFCFEPDHAVDVIFLNEDFGGHLF